MVKRTLLITRRIAVQLATWLRKKVFKKLFVIQEIRLTFFMMLHLSFKTFRTLWFLLSADPFNALITSLCNTFSEIVSCSGLQKHNICNKSNISSEFTIFFMVQIIWIWTMSFPFSFSLRPSFQLVGSSPSGQPQSFLGWQPLFWRHGGL